MTKVFVDTNVLGHGPHVGLDRGRRARGAVDAGTTRRMGTGHRAGQRRSAASAAAITAAIREYFADSEVPEPEYAHLIARMPGKDPDDRVHRAAAVAGHAAAIVTWNLADFPAEALAAHGVQVCTPDDYLCDLLDSWPDEVLGSVVRLAGESAAHP